MNAWEQPPFWAQGPKRLEWEESNSEPQRLTAKLHRERGERIWLSIDADIRAGLVERLGSEQAAKEYAGRHYVRILRYVSGTVPTEPRKGTDYERSASYEEHSVAVAVEGL